MFEWEKNNLLTMNNTILKHFSVEFCVLVSNRILFFIVNKYNYYLLTRNKSIQQILSFRTMFIQVKKKKKTRYLRW